MYEIKYNIKLSEDGRPYIDLPKDYKDKPEDKFFVIELTRYLFISILNNNGGLYDENTKAHIENTLDLLDKVSVEMADIIKKILKGEDVINYDIRVNDIKERDNLNYKGIIYNDKIFNRKEGLKVLVLEDLSLYELKGGIDNKHWTKI